MTTAARWKAVRDMLARIEPLNFAPSVHDREGFTCGDEALEHYLRTGAGQDSRRGFAAVFVAVQPGGNELYGYYTLSAASVDLTDMPEKWRKKMPRYGQVPAVLLGRLAVAKEKQGQGLGALLLADAITRSNRGDLGWAVFIIKAKHNRAASFYEHFGFHRFAHEPLLLWASRNELKALIK